MRINVFISSTGFCSRREADRLVESGRVTINGTLAKIGMDVSETDQVFIDKKPIQARPEIVYLAFNKPEGIESTTDQSKKNNIIDYLNYPERIFPIGRLDKDTSGLILLTNDGMIVNKILRSEFEHEKEYEVLVDHKITADFVQSLSQGVQIYNPVRHITTVTKPCKVVPSGDNAFTIILTQGLNLQIRRMCSALGYRVIKLKRTRIINIHLGNLPLGKYRLLTADELEYLKSTIEKSESETN